MKYKPLLIICSVGLIALIGLWLARTKPSTSTSVPQAASTEADEGSRQEQSQSLPQALANRAQPASHTQPPPVPDLAYAERAIADQKDRVKELEEKWKAQLSAPINFYGKVVDSNEQPVEGAKADFSWNDLPADSSSYTGESFSPFALMHSSESHTTTDSAGLFSLSGKKGKGLSVTVSKVGYYSTGDARLRSFEYGDPVIGIFNPDPKNPVVFHLRKKGPGVELITSQGPIRPNLVVVPKVDGSPMYVDFFQGKPGPSGQLEIRQVKPDPAHWQEASEWSFRINIPDGGFVECEDEFPFEAPAANYQPTVEIHPSQSDTNWTHFQRSYYIAFGQQQKYGRIRVETDIYSPNVLIEYAVNPDGSHYLEPK